MNTYRFAFLFVALVALLSSCATTAPSDTSTGGVQPAVSASPDGPEHSLQKGMTADAVKQIMGEPAEIKPMPSPTGKAEVWVYHRRSNGATRQIQVGTQMGEQIEIIDQTISLLMFEGRLMEQKQSTQTLLEYK